MPISMVVTNRQPEICEDVPQSLLDLFQDFTFQRDGQRHYPFRHQAEAFKLVGQEQKEVFLVAGTASGKTLAIAIPLFWKLKQGLIRKVLLMSQLKGGMSWARFIEAFNKPVKRVSIILHIE